MKVDPAFAGAVARLCVAMGLTEREAEALQGPLVETPAIRSVRRHTEGALLFLGDPGTGKTMAAQRWQVDAYLRPVNWTWDGFTWRYRHEGRRLFRTARQLAQVKQYEAADVERLMGARLLVVDDLGQEYLDARGFLASFIDHLVTERHRRGLPTVITANLSVQEFKTRYGDRALDRIEHTGGFEFLEGNSLRGGHQLPATITGIDWPAVWARRDAFDRLRAAEIAEVERRLMGRLRQLEGAAAS